MTLIVGCSSKPSTTTETKTITKDTLSVTIPANYNVNEYETITEITGKRFTQEVLYTDILSSKKASLEEVEESLQESLNAYRDGGFEITEYQIPGANGYKAEKDSSRIVFFFIDESNCIRYIVSIPLENDVPQDLVDAVISTMEINP